MPDLPAAISARVRGLLRGHDLDSDAVLAFERDALVLQTGRARLSIELGSIDGWAIESDALHIHVHGGDVVSVAASEPGDVAAELDRWAFALPELTRSLRVFGSRRAASGARRPEHDAFFEPFLAARGEAERASTLDARRAALDALALRNTVERRLRRFAAERYPTDAPERRALEAELSECVAPLVERFGALGVAQARLADSADAERVARWREWSHALATLFESADLCWPELSSVLTDDRREAKPRWRFPRPW